MGHPGLLGSRRQHSGLLPALYTGIRFYKIVSVETIITIAFYDLFNL